jgi:hypothetical protein
MSSIGDSLSLLAEGLDARGSPVAIGNVRWTVSPSAVGSITSDERFVAAAAGSATIVATLVSDSTVTGSRRIVVRPVVSRLRWEPLTEDLLDHSPLSALRVRLEDARGNLVRDAADSVTLALTFNPTGGPLQGTTTARAVDGVAEFGQAQPFSAGAHVRFAAQLGTLRAETDSLMVRHRFVSIAIGELLACGRDTLRRTYCWGTGEAFVPTSVTRVALPLRAASIFDLSAAFALGEDGICALEMTVGLTEVAIGETLCVLRTEAMWCLPGGSGPSTPLTRVPGGQPALRSLRVADDSYCALVVSSGNAWCGGSNFFGQLGDGTKIDRASLAPVGNGSLRLADLDLGPRHACGVDLAGVAWCWGSNSNGALGDLIRGESLVPTAVPAQSQPLRTLQLGSAHACGLGTDARAYCWGWNGQGQLGTGASTASVGFARVPLSEPVSQVVAGGDTSCALTLRGQAFCWGFNRFGTVGHGAAANSAPVPVAVGVSP